MHRVGSVYGDAYEATSMDYVRRDVPRSPYLTSPTKVAIPTHAHER